MLFTNHLLNFYRPRILNFYKKNPSISTTFKKSIHTCKNPALKFDLIHSNISDVSFKQIQRMTKQATLRSFFSKPKKAENSFLKDLVSDAAAISDTLINSEAQKLQESAIGFSKVSDEKDTKELTSEAEQYENKSDLKKRKKKYVASSSSESENDDIKPPKLKVKDNSKKKGLSGLNVNNAKTERSSEILASTSNTAIDPAVPESKDCSLPTTQVYSGSKFYSAVCEVFARVESTTKRLEITEIMSQFFLHMIPSGPGHLAKCVYLCINQVAPEYEGIEVGVGESLLMKAIASATGKNLARVKTEVEKLGDLGTVAEAFRTNQTTMFPMPKLTVDKVFDTFYEISTSSGSSSQQKKINKISSLIVAGSKSEAKYIVRSLEGKLRIGLAEKTVLVALAQAFTIYHSKSNKKEVTPDRLSSNADIVKNVYTQLPNFKILLEALMEYEVEKLLEIIKLVPGIPIKPMLAHPTKAISEVLDRFSGVEFTCEYKYDGERIQVHKDEKGNIISFSRNSENTTDKYSDIISKFHEFTSSDVANFIIDAEVVAWDTAKQCILPFQILSTRKRKDVKESEITVQVCLFAFDILYLNGESLLQTPLHARREILRKNFVCTPGKFQYARFENLKEVDDIQAFLDHSILDNCEGLMVKVLDGEESFYEPSKRSRNWLKVKKDYLQGVGDSLDLVVIGAYIGKGKRTGVYGGFLLASYDPDKEEYQSICKIGTGFSEADLKSFKEGLEKYVISIPKSYYSYGEATKPDVWFEPVQVWEVKAADLSISPVYKSAIGYVSEDKGISLRFPRFIRVREDKSPEDATNSEQISEMFEAQGLNQQS